MAQLSKTPTETDFTLPKEAGGVFAANEILVNTPAIKNLIRENKIAQIYSALQTGAEHGMRTMDQHLHSLVSSKIVSRHVAFDMATDKIAFSV